MKTNTHSIITACLFVISILFSLSGQAQFQPIQINNAVNSNTCNLNGEKITVTVASEVLSGDNIQLNINLPGTYPQNCIKTVRITPSNNLIYTGSTTIPFSTSGSSIVSDPSALPGNVAQNFNVNFQFPGYITCNGEIGTFDVLFELDCNGQLFTCAATVNVTARAANYWTIEKKFLGGNLVCGVSSWQFTLDEHNPNGTGLGTYNISGSITENTAATGVPVINGATHQVNNLIHRKTFITNLRNCMNASSTITNVADYNFTLGNGCEQMVGSVTDDSAPLTAPNASLSFVKYVEDNNTFSNLSNNNSFNLPPGCSGRFIIRVYNNGNVPWTNISITDDLNIPGITIANSIALPGGWSANNVANVYTFQAPAGFVLNPNERFDIKIPFTVDASTPVNTEICNGAQIQYQALGAGNNQGGGNSGGNNNTGACPGINCPQVTTAIQNYTDTTCFRVSESVPRVSLKKCIVNPPNTTVPPIYSVGDLIDFTIMVGNSGAGALTTTVHDDLTFQGQNLEIDPTSIQYAYFENRSFYDKRRCNPNWSPMAPPFGITANTADLQNPKWDINGMPGNCDMQQSNYLIISFSARILPQLYGNKINEARIDIPQGGVVTSQVNYSVDQTGILDVRKTADVETVGIGQSFNYLITLSNDGSVPLNNVVVTDLLPECVDFDGSLSIQDAAGTPISYTTSGNLVIAIDPTVKLIPNNDFTITIPVTKQGGGSCCNERVEVTADMETSGVTLMANYGDAQTPAACVSSEECCEIEDFSATLLEKEGRFYLDINGGANPIQEVEIAMIDYHVTYTKEACQPDDMGMFGTLSTSAMQLGGLTLTQGDNNTSSLSWILGSPSVINSTVDLMVKKPAILNLSCCNVDIHFCLKVKIIDVDCNVCERVICYSPENNDTTRCALQIETIKDSYCRGEVVDLNWTSNVPDGILHIWGVHDAGNSSDIIATNVQGSGSLQFTIPLDADCDDNKQYYFLIGDDQLDCAEKTDLFTVKCCDTTPDCNCGRWKSNTVAVLDERMRPISRVRCSGRVGLSSGTKYTFQPPNYVCDPTNCDAEFNWEVIMNGRTIHSHTGRSLEFSFRDQGTYTIVLTPICGGKKCDTCEFSAVVRPFRKIKKNTPKR